MITRAAQVVRDKLDVLLDRLTDSALGVPAPGTAQWRERFHTSAELTHTVRSGDRAEIRRLIADRAGVTDPAAAPTGRGTGGAARAPRRKRPRTDPAQLSIF